MNISKNSLSYSVVVVSLLSFISKIFGFLRESVTAAYIGTTVEADIFFLAYSIYTVLTFVLGSAIGISYLPIFVKDVERVGVRGTLKKTSIIINQIIVYSLVLTVIIYVGAPYIAIIIAPTFSDVYLYKLTSYIQVMALSLGLSIAVQVLFAVFNGQKKYTVSILVGMLYSIVSIFMIVVFFDRLGVKALLYSVVITAILQFFLLSCLSFFKYRSYSLSVFVFNQDLKHLYMISIPVLLGTGTIYIAQAIDKIIASTLTEGSVSALNYSGIIHSIINTLIISSLVTVFYTEMSKTFASTGVNKLVKSWQNGIVVLLLLTMPIAVVFYFNSEDIVSILFKRGAFGSKSVYLTAVTLSFYVIGTPFFAIRDLTTRVFYVLNDTKTPMINGFVTVVINAILSFALSLLWGVKGITLASAITSVIASLFLIYSLRRRQISVSLNTMKKDIHKLLLALLASIVLYILFTSYLYIENVILRLVVNTSFIVISYFFIVIVLDVKNIRKHSVGYISRVFK